MEEKFLNNLYLNHIGYFSISLLERKETIEKTINLLDVEDSFQSNINCLNRVSHLYHTSKEKLEPLREILTRNSDFIDVQIINDSSTLGLPYKVYATHKNGQSLYFDGLLYLVEIEIKKDKFSFSDLNSIAGYPFRADEIIKSLGISLKGIIPSLNEWSYSMYSFYTAEIENWKELGITRIGEAQLHIPINDPNFVTLTGLIHTKFGKEYSLFLGEKKIIQEMNSHDMFLNKEFKDFTKFINHLREENNHSSSTINDSMNNITKAFYKFIPKYSSWNKAKESISKVYKIKKSIFKYILLKETINELINKKMALRNSPKQIWLENEEIDNKWLNSYWCQNFFNVKLINKNIETVEDENQVMSPIYSSSAKELINKIQFLDKEVESVLGESRDLLSTIQAEFSMYAVWLAIFAVLISVLIGIIDN